MSQAVSNIPLTSIGSSKSTLVSVSSVAPKQPAPSCQCSLLRSHHHSFLRKVIHNWGLIVAKARRFSSTASYDALVDELFESSSESLDFFLPSQPRLTSPTEERFLELYKDHMSLESLAKAAKSDNALLLDEEQGQDTIEALQSADQCNYGPCLWEARRKQWTSCDDIEKCRERALRLLIADIPKESYPVIYNTLVDKRKVLKTALNLGDLATIISAGWVADERWARAAKGLP